MILPSYVEAILNKLEKNGFEAFVTGGAVRDSVMGREPQDYDVATSALPFEVKRIFDNTKDTGLKHGTVTLLSEGKAIEVTTFRHDGEYCDKRHPANVEFVNSILMDLQRRDFTINAIAYNKDGFVDPFGGQEDIKNKIIRTVGNAQQRFFEDALRILRCIRFSATLNFSVEKNTYEACKKFSYTLKEISAERVLSELNKTFACCNGTHLVMLEETGILKTVLPLWEGLSSKKIKEFEDSKTLAARWVILLGENTSKTLESLKSSRRERGSAMELEKYDYKDNKFIYASHMKYATPEEFFDYIHDREALDYFENSGIPKSLDKLLISGKDLIELGLEGEKIGKVMKALYEHTVLNPADNSKQKLKERALWLKENLPKE